MKKNIVYQWSYQILAILLPIITTPYISRTLGAENLGIFSYNFSVSSYFMLFAMLGVNTYGSRCIAEIRDDKEKTNVVFSQIFFAQVITSIVVFGIYVFYIIGFSSNKLVSLVQLVYIVGCIFDINWFYFGLEKFKITVTRNFVVKVVTVLLIFIFVNSSDDLLVYVAIMALGTIISQSMMWSFYNKYFKLQKVKLCDVVKHYKGLLIYFIPTIAMNVYKLTGKLILGNTSSMEFVGYYENSEKVINLVLSFIIALGNVMLSRTTNMVAKGEDKGVRDLIDNTMKFVLWLTIGITFGLIGVSDLFVPIFFGNGYETCISLLQILSVSIVFSSISNVLRTQYLIPYGKDKEFSISLISGAVINVLCNVILVPYMAVKGTVITVVLTEILVCGLQIYFSKKIFNFLGLFKDILLFLIAGLVMLVVMKVLPFTDNIYLSIVLQVVIGIIIYLVFSGSFVIKMLKFIKTADIIK